MNKRKRLKKLKLVTMDDLFSAYPALKLENTTDCKIWFYDSKMLEDCEMPSMSEFPTEAEEKIYESALKKEFYPNYDIQIVVDLYHPQCAEFHACIRFQALDVIDFVIKVTQIVMDNRLLDVEFNAYFRDLPYRLTEESYDENGDIKKQWLKRCVAEDASWRKRYLSCKQENRP